MARLQDVQGPTHIALAEAHQRLGRLWHDFDVLLLNDLVYQHPNILLLQRAEAETRAPGKQGRAELVGVVGNDAEARVGRVFFHNPAERHLRRVCHGISLVKNDELKPSDA